MKQNTDNFIVDILFGIYEEYIHEINSKEITKDILFNYVEKAHKEFYEPEEISFSEFVKKWRN